MERAASTNIHPAIILKEDVIEANKLTIGEAAGLLDVSRLTISKIANGKASITPNIALRIESVFGGNADFWLRMQRGYDLMDEKIKFKANPPNVKRFALQQIRLACSFFIAMGLKPIAIRELIQRPHYYECI